MIPDWAFLTAEKYVQKHKPEKRIEPIPYDPKKWKIYFGMANPKLLLSNIGTYSIAKPQMGGQLIAFIKKQIKNIKNLVVTETHGGLGGFTIPLAANFKKVQTVEIEKVHADIIKNNVSVLNHRNVQVYENDFMEIYPSLQQDVIVCDPPWGGLDYHEKKNIQLGLNNVNIIYFINKLAREKRYSLFVLLVPANYDFNNFFRHLDADLVARTRIEYSNPARPHHFFIGIRL